MAFHRYSSLKDVRPSRPKPASLQDKHGNTSKAEETGDGGLGASSSGSDGSWLGTGGLSTAAPGGVGTVVGW